MKEKYAKDRYEGFIESIFRRRV